MRLNIFFSYIIFNFVKVQIETIKVNKQTVNFLARTRDKFKWKKKLILKSFFQKNLTLKKVRKFQKRFLKKVFSKKIWYFLNKFLLNFLEFFFKKNIIFNIKKKKQNKFLKKLINRNILKRFSKKNIKFEKNILGVLYYSFLLKDTTIFINFLKVFLENTKLKFHKKLLVSLRKLIKIFYKPLFRYLNVMGIFLNVKGKIGASGNAKKKRYFFYFGEHSFTNKTLKVDLSHVVVWTYTGVLGLTFYIFF